MPKVSKLQPGFNTGQISKNSYGRADNPKYDMALALCQNYLPLLQGPIYRRPGTKFVAYAKNHSQPPVLIPFQYSAIENYMLEFGDKYIRFYTNEAQVLTTSNSFKIYGSYNFVKDKLLLGGMQFSGIRSYSTQNATESIMQSSLVAAGSILEVPTWYQYSDLPKIKFTQKQDTLYLAHPAYPPSKLVRTSPATWELKQILFQDGPYLPLNSYLTIADSANVAIFTSQSINTSNILASTSPFTQITSATVSTSIVTVSAAYHGFNNGDKVFIDTFSANLGLANHSGDGNNTPFQLGTGSTVFWTIQNVGTGSFQIAGTGFSTGVPSQTSFVYPALLQAIAGSSGFYWNDLQVCSNQVQVVSGMALRSIALISGGTRYWGQVMSVTDAAHFGIELGPNQPTLAQASSAFWQMGTYNYINGFPSATCFHQDRLVFAGVVPGYPQEIDASMTSLYEAYSASGSNLQVNANNALQFNLNSQDQNAIHWVKSSPQGLVAGTQAGEWAITPTSQGGALSPTNVAADQVTGFGSYDVDAVFAGTALIYIQRAQRRIRELLYFWQVGNFRSTNLSEMADSVLLPGLQKIVNQKDVHPVVWGLRTDGQLVSMTYNRDDVTLQSQAGFAQHVLGGQSDAGFSPPIVKSMGIIPSSDTTFDELWLSTQRYIQGSTLAVIEYMFRPFDETIPQELSYFFDCGYQINSSVIVQGLSVGGSCIVTANNHGFNNGNSVRFYNAVGFNLTTTDTNGNFVSTSFINEQLFQVTSVSTNQFFIKDFFGNYVNTGSASAYVGSCTVNVLSSAVTGLTWLANETVSVLADGMVHVNTSVSATGVLNLAFPAAIVSVGYQYNSDAQMLRTHDGSAQGTSIGSYRRVNRVAFMLHNVGDFSFGPSFDRMNPVDFEQEGVAIAGQMTPLFDGIFQQGIEGISTFTDSICWRQNTGLPGMVQAVTRFFEESDV